MNKIERIIKKIVGLIATTPRTCGGDKVTPEDVLTSEQIDKALSWYDNHRNHVNGLVYGANKFPPTLNEDKRDCRLWKPGHWAWFLNYYH